MTAVHDLMAAEAGAAGILDEDAKREVRRAVLSAV